MCISPRYALWHQQSRARQGRVYRRKKPLRSLEWFSDGRQTGLPSEWGGYHSDTFHSQANRTHGRFQSRFFRYRNRDPQSEWANLRRTITRRYPRSIRTQCVYPSIWIGNLSGCRFGTTHRRSDHFRRRRHFLFRNTRCVEKAIEPPASQQDWATPLVGRRIGNSTPANCRAETARRSVQVRTDTNQGTENTRSHSAS